MHELWDGCRHWSEEDEQAEEDARAIRIVTCLRKGCPRMRTCERELLSKRRCLGRVHPKTEDEEARLIAALRFMLKRSLMEDEGDPETARIAKEARAAAQARRRAAAWERASALMKTWVAQGPI
jgi:hypothetical protein